jgi:ribonuclease BN (tRNA processing enzyme)
MPTRRGFLTAGAAVTAALAGEKAGRLEAASEEGSAKRQPHDKPGGKRSSLRLHLLGCGYPPPYGTGDRIRHGSAFLLEVGPELLLIDCGPATTYKMARMGIDTKRVNHVFLTHHHFDHNVDLPCFVLVRWDLCKGTESPLKVYGPPPTQRFVEQLFSEEGAFYPDWHSRVAHPVSIEIFQHRGGVPPRPAPALETHEAGPGTVAETGSWSAKAARVRHVEPTLESLAYRFDTDRGSIVFAGDCGDCPTLRELAEGADTLVAPCVCVGTAESPSYLKGIIMGTDEVRSIAKSAGVRRVVLTHNGSVNTPEKRQPFLDAVSQVFGGEVCFPDELTTIDLQN